MPELDVLVPVTFSISVGSIASVGISAACAVSISAQPAVVDLVISGELPPPQPIARARFAGLGVLTAGISTNPVRQPAFSSAGSLQAVIGVPLPAVLIGAGTLSVVAIPQSALSASLTGAGVLAAAGVARYPQS